jgi:hypothetical protein
MGSEGIAGRKYTELPSLFIIEQPAEDKATIKLRPTEPAYIGIFVNMRQKSAVSDESVIISVLGHSSFFNKLPL